MPAQVFWDQEDSTIIIREMSGNWTWEEYFTAIKQVNELIKSVDYRVDVIVDASQTFRFPTAALSNMTRANKDYPPNMGIQVIVASNRIVEMFADMLRKVMPQAVDHFLSTQTLEQARDMIYKARAGEPVN